MNKGNNALNSTYTTDGDEVGEYLHHVIGESKIRGETNLPVNPEKV